MRSEKDQSTLQHDEARSRELGERFLQICRMTDEMLKNMSPADRDRMLQRHLAAARGPKRNFLLLCEMTDALASIRRIRLRQLRGHHG